MNFRDLRELKTKLLEIKNKDFIKTSRKGDQGGVGRTLEDEMDISENNYVTGDFKVGKQWVELKAQRKSASNRVTLGTKEPTWNGNKHKIIEKTGYIDAKGRQALKIILNARGFNNKDYRLMIKGFFGKRICIVHKKEGEVCFFNMKAIMKVIKGKLGKNLLFVLADSKKKGNLEYYHYTDAVYFSNLKVRTFKKLLKQGKIIWEFRLHLKPSGAIRDHGSGFRINRKFIGQLYKKRITLL